MPKFQHEPDHAKYNQLLAQVKLYHQAFMIPLAEQAYGLANIEATGAAQSLREVADAITNLGIALNRAKPL